MPMESVHDLLQLFLVRTVQHPQNDEVTIGVAGQLENVGPQLLKDGSTFGFRPKLNQSLQTK